jgi:hypothetical protein
MMQSKEANGKRSPIVSSDNTRKLTHPNTGFIMLIVTGQEKAQTKYGWLCTLLEWTNITRHDLITHNIWPRPERTTSQVLNTMNMHDKQWGTYRNLWNTTKNT